MQDSIDYRTWRERLERIDEILRTSQVEEAFVRLCLKRRRAVCWSCVENGLRADLLARIPAPLCCTRPTPRKPAASLAKSPENRTASRVTIPCMRVSRRKMVWDGTVACLGLAAGWPGSRAAQARKLPSFSIRTLTRGPKHHFFGYYGITPWNQSGKYLVCLESEFQDHLPSPDEPASICLADARSGDLIKVGETRAWNFQQGAMLHWNPLQPEREILFNDRHGDRIAAVVLDVDSGRRRTLPRAVNAVSRNGRYALSLTYGRLTRMRPVVGYVGVKDPNPDSPHPDNDGVFRMDLATGETELIVSIGEVYRRLVKPHPELTERHMWFNHVVFNRNDTRFLFLARCWTPEQRLESAMFTAALDGSGLREVVPFGRRVSHFEWRNEREIMATFVHNGQMQHVLFTYGRDDYRTFGKFLEFNGHCSFGPDENWLVTDRGSEEKLHKELILYNVQTGQGAVLGAFPMKERRYLVGDVRCDLHPRWNRAGDAICFDALETSGWTRQLHLAERNF